MFKQLSLVFLLLAMGAIAQAQQIKFSEYDLPNGLHVILHQDNSTPLVSIGINYDVGSKNEQSDRTGFAHFFEHLMFEGTPNIPQGQYGQIIEKFGGSNNAFTSFDRTFYFESVPSNYLETALWMEAERMFQLKINTKGLETQRKVVKEEKKLRYENQPYGSVMEQVFKHAFTKHPYQWMPIGSAQYIDEASLSEFQDFYNTFYVPNNAVLCIAGDFQPGQAKEWVSKYFGHISKAVHKIPRPTIIEPPLGREVRDTVYDNIQLPAVIVAYRIPAGGTDDYYTLSMIGTLLSGGESSRLNKNLVDKKQIALASGASPLETQDPGVMFMFAVANMGIDAKALEDAMDIEIEKIKTEMVDEREFQKLKNQIENDFVGGNGSLGGIVQNITNYYTAYGDANLINTEWKRYQKVTAEDLQRIAKKYLRKDNRVVLHYLPKKQ